MYCLDGSLGSQINKSYFFLKLWRPKFYWYVKSTAMNNYLICETYETHLIKLDHIQNTRNYLMFKTHSYDIWYMKPLSRCLVYKFE
jgi:hypothetical protein